MQAFVFGEPPEHVPSSIRHIAVFIFAGFTKAE
jgi:hypothetical protein